jgi:hypothetical protein
VRSPGTFVAGLVSLLFSFGMVCCLWPLAIPLFILGVVLMIVGGRSAPPQTFQQVYYYPPQAPNSLPPPPPGYQQLPPQPGQLRQNPDGTWS